MPDDGVDAVAHAIKALEDGDPNAAERLLPLVYRELHALASRYFRAQQPGQTLQPTALVHEAYLKMVGGGERSYRGRAHFLAVAANAMRQILIDRARRRRTEKHGGGLQRVALDDRADAVAGELDRDVDVLALDEALRRLAALDERKARVVELRFFSGMSMEETAEILGISRTTVSEEWRLARAWISRELERGANP